MRATSSDPDESVFLGIARTDDVADYLRDVEHSTVTDLDDPEYVEHDGGAPATDPADARHLGRPVERSGHPERRVDA